MLDPETRGLFASIGIVKGKKFAPDDRMKKLLTVAIGNAAARANNWCPRMDKVYIYPDTKSEWVMGYPRKNVFFSFDGAKTYRLHLPPNVPAEDFWAVTLYDTQTRSQLQTDQPFPTVGSQDKGFQRNPDGSFDVYFAPTAPKGKDDNWRQTIPGKSWFAILRIYGPLKPWIDKTWRPSEIELVK